VINRRRGHGLVGAGGQLPSREAKQAEAKGSDQQSTAGDLS
jgi:hypothetical protein